MRLERVVAKDARRATEQVLANFGPDALIVSNQRVNGMTEIVVAVDTDSPSEAPKSHEPVQTARVFAPRADREFGRSLLESFKSSTAGDRPQQPRAMATPEPSDAPALSLKRSPEPSASLKSVWHRWKKAKQPSALEAAAPTAAPLLLCR